MSTQGRARTFSTLYDPHRDERDACGIGFVADAAARPSHAIISAALSGLCSMRHRGAVAADARSGDGAGLLLPIHHAFFARDLDWPGGEETRRGDETLLGVAMAFLPAAPTEAARARELVAAALAAEGLELLTWRVVPVDESALGAYARASAPRIEQALFRCPTETADERERRCFRAGRRAAASARDHGSSLYVASVSARTVTYKALCAADQLGAFYPDLTDPAHAAGFAVFHQRYSTNTLPSWERAQPFRFLCHNGEINTLEGNRAWMRAREGNLGTEDLAPPELLTPVLDPDASDSGMLDNALELLVRAGRDVRHALAMLVPAAYGELPEELGDFYRYHQGLTEPWDGPAGLVFTDGVRVGAALDRNGLRPMRWAASEDGLVVCASEAGAIDLGGGRVRRGRLGPGQMLCVDPVHGLQLDADVKAALAERQPYGEWLAKHLRTAEPGSPLPPPETEPAARQVAYGFTRELITSVLRPMSTTRKEPTGSMGDDTPPAVIGLTDRPVGHYLRQRFAQVTNPPIDHLRERGVLSKRVLLGRREPLCSENPEGAALTVLPTFVLTPDGLDALVAPTSGLRAEVLDATWPVTEGEGGLAAACRRLGEDAEAAVRSGCDLLVVDDGGEGGLAAPTLDRPPTTDDPRSRRPVDSRVAVPSLLAVGAVRHHLVRAGLATQASLVVATDEPVDSHQAATLVGYGAEALCPRLTLATVAALGAADADEGGEAEGAATAQESYAHALEEGVFKIMSKMGISVLAAYTGAQIFEAVGLGAEVVETCFAGTPSPVGGVGFAELARPLLARHSEAQAVAPRLANPGWFKYRPKGEYHATNPPVMQALQFAAREGEEVRGSKRGAHALQQAVKGGGYERYEHFAQLVNERPPSVLRDLLEVVGAGPPVPLEEVEPVEAIMARFSTAAMSHGALSTEAHETLAQAMHLIGGKANSGEGGESPARYGTDKNSVIKQVASGRFGVTPAYLASATELQIKMAQGSKPGEGGQIPGIKVTEEIAQLRHTQPGVALISPPPHHDIYSIEDLAQLVFDLKQANPAAEVSVKLVAEAGVGTIASGVAKALAEVVQVSGAEGGTGASPLSSIKHGGGPWELGLAETQQALVANGLRGRVRVRVDGGFKTGRDVLLAALLGADEYGFGTAALLAQGCLMVRTCHQNNCPVGIATQKPELRAKFTGKAEHVANYLRFVAEEVRRLMAAAGLRGLDEAIGRVDLLRQRESDGHAGLLDLSPLLADVPVDGPRSFQAPVEIQRARSALGDRVHDDVVSRLERGEVVHLTYEIANTDRAVGARLGVALGAAHGEDAPAGRARLDFTGAAGQSFGAYLAAGVDFRLTGTANDYVGKGLGGGRIAIRPPADDAGDPVLAGNTVLYGATGGELFLAGRAGERFAVRNSGATAVVEGAGDHLCEYMTGGTVVALGPVGGNVGAGMSGGELFVHDTAGTLPGRLNAELVAAERPDALKLTRLRELVARHVELTGSAVGAALLADWERAVARFWRVAPIDEVASVEERNEGTG
jgi:glutamate synthase domain-containing protein 2/glutamate synthase domain-containing protein 1/glutamate synthase domain-containing protein 3